MADSTGFPLTAGALTAKEIRQCVGKDDPVIVELGANCGQTTVEMLREMPGATIHCFEPDPRAIAKFRAAIQHPNVHLYECAVGAVNGTITFNQSSGAEDHPEYRQGWDQSGSIRRPNTHLNVWPWVKFEKQITVPITTLDTWSELHQVSTADFIWADVQGAESDFVDGGARFVPTVRYLYTEYSDDEYYEGQITLAGLLGKLPDFNLIMRFRMDALLQNKREQHRSSSKVQKPSGKIIYPQIQL